MDPKVLPVVRTLDSLPIDAHLEKVQEMVLSHPLSVLTAEPGTGKTTRVPAFLRPSFAKKIAVLEPRRLAAVGACQRVAEENQWQVGQEVGYQVRLESQVSANTSLIYMTEGILLKRLLQDPELDEFSLIVLDEFHERNLNQDLLLGILRQLHDLGTGPRLLIMSATLDVEALKAFDPGLAHLHVAGLSFPLEVRYTPENLSLMTDANFDKRVALAVERGLKEAQGHLLVFLPGLREMQRVQELLEARACPVKVRQLHGSLPLQEQKELLQVSSERRVILATNVAEASVTVPGVDYVIDSGLAKVSSLHLKSGFTRLDLRFIAKFNADQRAGRAARLKAGIAVRLWPQTADSGQELQMVPEVQRSDLTGVLLQLALLGERNFDQFPWLSPPPKVLLDRAQSQLTDWGALDHDKRLTARGRDLLRFPVEPRLAFLLLESGEDLQKAAFVVALLSDRDPFRRQDGEGQGFTCDLEWRWHQWQSKNPAKSSLSRRAASLLQQNIKDLIRTTQDCKSFVSKGNLDTALLLSHQDRICRRRGKSERALMVGGRGVRVGQQSLVQKAEFFIALQGMDGSQQAETLINLATPVSRESLEQVLNGEIQEVSSLELKDGRLYQRRLKEYRGLTLKETDLEPVAGGALRDYWVEQLKKTWDQLLDENASYQEWLSRWQFFKKVGGQSETLLEDLQRQAQEVLLQQEKLEQGLSDLPIGKAMLAAMDWNVRQEFDKLAPASFQAPSGVNYPIHYSATEPPYVEVRIQELFGLKETPPIGSSGERLSLKLLAPNYRPAQQTRDLASFWQNGYPEVRKELRGRYPKHPWPEDPTTALPVVKGRSHKPNR